MRSFPAANRTLSQRTWLPVVIVAFVSWFAAADRATAQVPASTYQGRLNDHGGPASGLYNLEFTLCIDPFTGGG